MREKIELLQEELPGLQAAMSPTLLAAVPKVIAYARNTIQRYPA